jgi:hypothetical protein
MGIRETLNQNPQIATAGTIGIIVVALSIICYQLVCTGGGAVQSGVNKLYFTSDDGATWFADDASKLPPFDKDGKQAVRSYVFTCDGGRTKFVGYLERYSPAAAEQIKKLRDQSAAAPSGAPSGGPSGGGPGGGGPGNEAFAARMSLQSAMQSGIEVKRPGDKDWRSISHPEAQQKTMAVNCPDGKGTLEPVYP